MADSDQPKCQPGSMEHAMFRRADAEHRKAEESAKWRAMVADIFAWVKELVTKRKV